MPLTFDNELVERFAKTLDKAKKIVILSHMNPDGDAVGSLLATYNWLKSAFFAGRTIPEITPLLPNPVPHDAEYLPGVSEIVDDEHNHELCEQLISDADVIIGVDFNNAGRVLPLDKALSNSPATKLLIDHHHNPDKELFHTILSVPDLSSTCELLYWLFARIIGDSSITLDTARCLYHGINTDTGCFSYACDDASLYEAVAALMRHPVEPSVVHDRLFNSYSVEKLNLLGYLISKRTKLFRDEHFAYFYIRESELSSLNCKASDLDGLVNYTLIMEEMQVGALVKEDNGRVRISFRAKNDFDVNRFANKYFGGGGHTKASGATSPYNFDDTIQCLETHMLKELKLFYNERRLL